jgi:hypothetical protein
MSVFNSLCADALEYQKELVNGAANATTYTVSELIDVLKTLNPEFQIVFNAPGVIFSRHINFEMMPNYYPTPTLKIVLNYYADELAFKERLSNAKDIR